MDFGSRDSYPRDTRPRKVRYVTCPHGQRVPYGDRDACPACHEEAARDDAETWAPDPALAGVLPSPPCQP